MTVVFFHAHPDDESIFTGGTLALLADAGIRTAVVLATGSDHPDAGDLARCRAAEARSACAELGVSALHLLGYLDAGDVTEPADAHEGRAGQALHRVTVDEVAGRLADVLRHERATDLVIYDEGGIYAHVDHLAVHRAGVAAARLSGIGGLYEATVDREYLHFVETHLVGNAVEWLVGAAAIGALNRAPLGVPTVEVTTMIDVADGLDRKRQAILAHASQIPSESPLRTMDDATFAAVYGYEWFVRRGPAGVLDRLSR